MTEEELQTYLIDHCQVIDMFREKALEFQNDRNHERSANKRWPQGAIENEVNKMVDQFISNVHKESQHFFGQFAKRLFVRPKQTDQAKLLGQDSLNVLVLLRGYKTSRCIRRLAF